MIRAITFFCPECYKVKMISVIEHGRNYPTEITDEWIDLLKSGYAVRTMPVEEAKIAEMCHTDHNEKP